MNTSDVFYAAGGAGAVSAFGLFNLFRWDDKRERLLMHSLAALCAGAIAYQFGGKRGAVATIAGGMSVAVFNYSKEL